MSYFAILGLKNRYDLDVNELKNKYIEALKKFHPDRAQIGEVKEYIDKSMEINKAYKILSNSYERAKYILVQRGYDFDDKSLSGVINQEDLGEILDEYDLIENTENIVELRSKELEKSSEVSVVIDHISKLFTEENFAKALDYTVRLKYLTNLVRNIKLKIKNANS